jgi:hypothetical protein
MRYRALLIALGAAISLAACGTHPPDDGQARIPVSNGNEPIGTYGYALAGFPAKASKDADGKVVPAPAPKWSADDYRRVQEMQGSCFGSIAQKYGHTRDKVLSAAKKRAESYPPQYRAQLIEQMVHEHFKDIGEAGGDCNVKMIEHAQKDGELKDIVPYHANDVVPDNPLPIPSN